MSEIAAVCKCSFRRKDSHPAMSVGIMGLDTGLMKLPFNFFRAGAEEPRIPELTELSLFKGLTSREVRELEELLHERSYQKEEIIFDEGDTGLGLYIIVNGRVRICSSHSALQQLA